MTKEQLIEQIGDRTVKIRKFPSVEGDEYTCTKLSTITKEEVFSPPYLTVINGKVAKTWDDLLRIACETPVETPFEVRKFSPVIPG